MEIFLLKDLFCFLFYRIFIRIHGTIPLTIVITMVDTFMIPITAMELHGHTGLLWV